MDTRINRILLVSACILTFMIFPLDAGIRMMTVFVKILFVPAYLSGGEAFWEIVIFFSEVILIFALPVLHILIQLRKGSKKLMVSNGLQLIALGYFTVNFLVFSVTEKKFTACSPLIAISIESRGANLLFAVIFLIWMAILARIFVAQIKLYQNAEKDKGI